MNLQYRVDRIAQRNTPLRKLDAFGLRHPLVDKLASAVVVVLLALWLSTRTHSWIVGVVASVVLFTIASLMARRNHKRRLENGTSAIYGPPK